MVRLIAILALLCSPVLADEPKPVDLQVGQKIWFPSLPVPDKAPVTPAPPADPDAVPALSYGQIYVVQGDTPFALLASPKGVVTITKTEGPINVRGIFADGNGEFETRTFKAKYVAFVDAVKGMAGRINLTAIPFGLKDESEITEQLVDIGTAPRPPPGPDDPPPGPVDPPPTPAPTGFRVIFVSDSEANMTREQLNIVNSTAIGAFLNEACAKSASGQPEWRRWGKQQKIDATESPTIVRLWTDCQPKLTALPRMLVAVNGAATVMEFGATEAETLAKLKTAAGVK